MPPGTIRSAGIILVDDAQGNFGERAPECPAKRLSAHSANAYQPCGYIGPLSDIASKNPGMPANYTSCAPQ